MLFCCSIPLSAEDADGSEIGITISSVRWFDDVEEKTLHDLMVGVRVDGEEFHSEIGTQLRCFEDPLNCTVQTDQQEIEIEFFVWEIVGEEILDCDLDKNEGIGSAMVCYNLSTGRWSGEDSIGDESGVRRLNGCDDGSWYSVERDVELCFELFFCEDDGDGVPAWWEENVLGTSPVVDDSSRDDDEDGIPLWWEWRWGFDPFVYDEYAIFDPEDDGLNGFEEFWMDEWGADPFRRDLFCEVDQMELGPNGEGGFVPQGAFQMMYDAYGRRNIVFNWDVGEMGGGEFLPYERYVFLGKEREYYQQFFLDDNETNWKRGVFRYGLMVYEHFPIGGLEFAGEKGSTYLQGLNSFVLSTKALEERCESLWIEYDRDLVYASVIMHELGHSMGIFFMHPRGCDNQFSKSPFGYGWWLWGNYVSCMNYRYVYSILDYSDGSHGWGDYDDWGRLRLSQFEPPDVHINA